MNADLDLRLKAFNRSLAVLSLEDHLSRWHNQPPEIFTAKHDEAVDMVAVLKDAAKQQETAIGGISIDKDREEAELETAAFTLSQALITYFSDHHQEAAAAELDLTKTDWHHLRDRQLLDKSKLAIDHATTLTTGTEAAAAAKYGITPAAVQNLTKERADYEGIVNAPSAAQAVRKALTKGFRPAFALVEKIFAELDALIIQFATTPAGRQMIATWTDARTQKGRPTAPTNPPAPLLPPPNPRPADSPLPPVMRPVAYHLQILPAG